MWAAVGVLAGLGALAVALGFRGRRIDDHPICRGCGFDLVGLTAPASDHSAEAARCPECGRELAGRRSVRHGARRRRRGLLALGALLLMTAAGWGGAVVWGQATAFDWNSVKPTWLLAMETRQPTAENADAGMQELVKRLEKGELSAERARALVARILEVQGNAAAPWHASWGDFVQAAHAAGALGAGDLERFARQAVAELQPLETQMAGARLFYGLVFDRPPRAGSQPAFYLQPVLRELRIDGDERSVGSGRVYMGLATSGAGSVGTTIPMSLPPGEHTWELVYEMIIIDHPSYEEAPPLVSWRETFSGTFTVRERKAPEGH